jgi:ABC-type polysaccharide/polyol phosphate export permease
MMLLLLLLVLIAVALGYFLPTIIAHRRQRRTGLVFLVNLFFGWTAIGWFTALLLAL